MLPTQLKSFLERVSAGAAGLIKKPRALAAVGICGILLIFASSMLSRGSEKKAQSAESSSVGTEEYREALEEGVRKIVTDITGDKKPTVVVTLESGIKYSYADSTEVTSSDSAGSSADTASRSETRSYITVRTSDGGEQALLITEQMPQVRGVAVICSGGDSPEIAEKISGAVTAAFNITSKRVYIAGGNSNEKR